MALKRKSSQAFDIKISLDQQKAFLTINPSAINVKVTAQRLTEVLKENGIIYGVKEAVLDKMEAIHKTRQVAPNILVAEGIPAVPGKKTRVIYKFKFSQSPTERGGQKVDYRDISSIIMIKKGDLLAQKRLLIQSKPGITVKGEKVEMEEMVDIPLVCGENVEKQTEGGTEFFRATADGALDFTGHVLSVSSSIRIPGDVNFNVGNIRFSGSVNIGGDVRPDFIIEAGGNIEIAGMALACKVKAGGYIRIQGGIIGKGRGTFTARGSIAAGHAENSQLTSDKNIIIKNSVSGSTLSCDQYFKLDGPYGRVVNSIIKAAKGIYVTHAGSRADSKTRLITGLIPAYEKEIQKMIQATEAKKAEVKLIEKRYGTESLQTRQFSRTITPEMTKDIEKWEIYSAEIEETETNLESWKSKMYSKDGFIKVSGTLHPGVKVEVGGIEKDIQQEYSNVIIRISPQTGELIIQQAAPPKTS